MTAIIDGGNNMSKNLDNKIKSCEFDKSDGCHALACYSGTECNSRNENGNPLYIFQQKKLKNIK